MDPTLKSRTISRLKQDMQAFSPRMKVAAKYIVDHPADFGLDSIRDSARKSGVSTFTLVRMAETLGFASYEDLREPFRHALVSSTPVDDHPDWIEEVMRHSEVGQIHGEAALNALSNAQRSLERQRPDLLEAVATTLLASDRVYVTAVRASYAMAFYFHYVGRMALTSLELIPRHMGSAIDELAKAEPGDTVIAIMLTPYSRETVEACRFAQGRGARLVLIADSDIVSDLKPDFLLMVSSNSTHHFACYSGVIAVLEGLLSILVKRGGPDAANRIREYRAIRKDQNAYVRVQKKHQL